MTKEQTYRDAIAHPDYAYSRTRWGNTYIYHRDRTSPTGVQVACGGPPEIIDPLIRELRSNSPLSPTEGLNKSGARAY